jgi:hypothetical protein
MASEQIASSVFAPSQQSQVHPLQAWLARLGLSGKLLAGGGLVGLIAVFLPLVSLSFQMPSGSAKGGVNVPALSTSQTVRVVQDFRGILCLLGYAGALALAYVLYAPTGLNPKTLGWAGVGVGVVVALLALWLLLGAVSGSGSLGGFRIYAGFGAYLNVVAAVVVATGGALKAREEGLF